VGISILNGAHMTLIPQVLEALRRRDMAQVGVIVGGTIPPFDREKLKEMGVDECFGSGDSIGKIVEFLSSRSR
jgi:methylmalonyl-CoA mutase C-terminal domain/subunit